MNTVHHQQFVNPLEDFDYPDLELVIGFGCAVGTDYAAVRDAVREILKARGRDSPALLMRAH